MIMDSVRLHTHMLWVLRFVSIPSNNNSGRFSAFARYALPGQQQR